MSNHTAGALNEAVSRLLITNAVTKLQIPANEAQILVSRWIPVTPAQAAAAELALTGASTRVLALADPAARQHDRFGSLQGNGVC